MRSEPESQPSDTTAQPAACINSTSSSSTNAGWINVVHRTGRSRSMMARHTSLACSMGLLKRVSQKKNGTSPSSLLIHSSSSATVFGDFLRCVRPIRCGSSQYRHRMGHPCLITMAGNPPASAYFRASNRSRLGKFRASQSSTTADGFIRIPSFERQTSPGTPVQSSSSSRCATSRGKEFSPSPAIPKSGFR